MHTILVDCPDSTGLVYSITSQLYELGLNIEQNDEFVDNTTGHFFMRTVVSGNCDESVLKARIKEKIPNAKISLASQKPKNIVVMATKEPHCLGDLLIRNEYNEFNASIKAVIANHEVLGSLVEKFNIPFHHISHKNKNRTEHENEILEVIRQYNPDYIVLAKYMRILQSSFIESFKHRIINIHHSFLPAFIGANPYRQAFERGVKIMGATAHVVTDNLDEGPIIEQDVKRVGHRFSAKDMARAGKDVEKIVLARALKLVFQDRVFIHGNKTIIF